MTMTTAAESAKFDFTSLTCPMPGCGEDLFVTWSANRPLMVGDLGSPHAPKVTDAYTETWQVDCLAGHVLLLPGVLGCPCAGDADGPSCPHDQDEYDQSDENRIFRRQDVDRLQQLVQGGVR